MKLLSAQETRVVEKGFHGGNLLLTYLYLMHINPVTRVNAAH